LVRKSHPLYADDAAHVDAAVFYASRGKYIQSDSRIRNQINKPCENSYREWKQAISVKRRYMLEYPSMEHYIDN